MEKPPITKYVPEIKAQHENPEGDLRPTQDVDGSTCRAEMVNPAPREEEEAE